MNLILYLYRRSWRVLFFTAVCGAIAGLCGARLIALIGESISGRNDMAMLGAQFFALCALQVLCKSWSQIAMLRTTQEAILDLRINLSRKLLATPFKKLQQLGKPELQVILTNDIDGFVGAFQILPAALSNIFVVVACLGYMAWLSWKMFLTAVVFLSLSMLAYHLAQRVPMRRMMEVRERVGDLFHHFRGLIDGSKELKLNAERGGVFVNDVIANSSREFKRSYVGSMTGFILTGNLGSTAFFVLLGIIMFVVPYWYPQDVASLATFALVLLYLIGPISELVGSVPGFAQGGISLSRISQLEGALSDLAAVPKANPDAFASRNPLQLELRGVCHRYHRETEEMPFTLGPIDLTIRQGECVFIVGGNGSGKTTLAMLLSGLYEPEAGHVLLNGKQVTAENVEAYRQHFSAVFSDFYLFENLLMADKPDISARAARYIKELGMEHKVKVVDGKFSTLNLSSGQRKRLALIASYLEDRPIYLFDEWASDQDPVFKRIFYTELLPELKSRGKTVLVITHDDMYFNHADRIVKLQDGKVQSGVDEAVAALALPA